MRAKLLWVTVGVVTIVLLLTGYGGLISMQETRAQDGEGLRPEAVQPEVSQAEVADTVTYQGRLTSSGGTALDGTYAMRFFVYDAESGGTALSDSGTVNVAVQNGLFSVDLNVEQDDFDGKAMWLAIQVEGQTLSPRQPLRPAPYALSLKPGATVSGEPKAGSEGVLQANVEGFYPQASAFRGTAATGNAVYGNSGTGVGIYGISEGSYGVWGASSNSWGGYFTSSGGHGIRVHTDGTAIYDYGAYVSSNRGYAVYAQSSENQAVRGEAGDVTGAAKPLGAVGLVGIGANRGIYGSSEFGSGLYGISSGNYGLWAQSINWRGATGRTSRSDNNYGLYTPDNLFSLNYHLTGSIMQVMENGGDDSLSAGDVVVFEGVNRSVTAVGAPVVQVSKAATADSTAVAGVVFSRFNLEAVNADPELPDDAAQGKLAATAVTPPGSAAPGEYVLVVVQGPAQVKAGEVENDGIRPGDLLSTSSTAGFAGKAATVEMGGVETTVPGTVFGKALETPQAGRNMIYVYVTLQ